MTYYDSRSTQAYHQVLEERYKGWTMKDKKQLQELADIFVKNAMRHQPSRTNPPHLGVPECGPGDPIFDIGREPVGGGISDASENLDKYLYGPRTLDDALAHARQCEITQQGDFSECVKRDVDDAHILRANEDLALLANEVLRLRSELSPLLSERIRKQQVQQEVRDFLDKNWARWSS